MRPWEPGPEPRWPWSQCWSHCGCSPGRRLSSRPENELQGTQVEPKCREAAEVSGDGPWPRSGRGGGRGGCKMSHPLAEGPCLFRSAARGPPKPLVFPPVTSRVCYSCPLSNRIDWLCVRHRSGVQDLQEGLVIRLRPWSGRASRSPAGSRSCCPWPLPQALWPCHGLRVAQ